MANGLTHERMVQNNQIGSSLKVPNQSLSFTETARKSFSSFKNRVQGAITSGKMTQGEGKQVTQRVFNDMRDALKRMDKNLTEAQKKTMTQEQMKEAFQRALEAVRNKPQKVVVTKQEKSNPKTGTVDGGDR